MLNRSRTFLTVALAVVCCLISGAAATEYDTADRLHISNLHHINDDYVSWSERLLVDGLIDGDMISGSGEITINGTVGGSANLFAAQIHHFGTIDRSLRIFAQSADIDGTVGGSVMAFAMDLTLGRPSVVTRDVSVFGTTVKLRGTVGGRVLAYAENISISGRITGDVEIQAEQLELIAPAVIEGNLIYTSEREMFIDDTTGVTIVGGIEWKRPSDRDESEDDGNAVAGIAMTTGKLLAAFIFGIIMMALSRRHADAAFRSLQNRLTTSLAAGVVTLLAFVFAVIVLIIALAMLISGTIIAASENATVGAFIFSLSVIALPISSFVSVAGGVLFYSGKIIAGFLIGYWIMCRRSPDCRPLGKGQLFLGLLILFLVFAIPYAGFVVYLAVSILGMGAIVLGIRYCQQTGTAAGDGPASPPPPIPPGSTQ